MRRVKTTLFDTGDKPKRPAPALTRAAIAATLADALDGLPPDRAAGVLAKALFALRPWELGAVSRLVVDFLRVSYPDVDAPANRGVPRGVGR